MIDLESARQLALDFEDAVEQPHFERTSFRVGKKIFATMDTGKKLMVVKLTDVEQSVFCSFEGGSVRPVPGGWGTKGWTEIDLKLVEREMFEDLLTTSYCNVAPQRLAKPYREALRKVE